MLILRPTIAIAKRLKLQLNRGLIHLNTTPAADWTLMEFKAPRGRYIMATNTPSLLSVMFSARKMGTEELFLRHLFSAMSEQLAHFGFAGQFATYIQPQLGTVGYERLENRSVRGSILDLQNQAWFHFLDGEINIPEMMLQINKSPMSILNMDSPLRRFPQLCS